MASIGELIDKLDRVIDAQSALTELGLLEVLETHRVLRWVREELEALESGESLRAAVDREVSEAGQRLRPDGKPFGWVPPECSACQKQLGDDEIYKATVNGEEWSLCGGCNEKMFGFEESGIG